MIDNYQISQVIQSAQQRLQDAGIDSVSARADAEILISFVLGCSRSGLYIGGRPECNSREEIGPVFPADRQISDNQARRFEELLDLRGQGHPVQYLTGKAFFYGLEFGVGPGVFIPRPETEILVQTVLEKVKPWLCSEHNAGQPACILDLGTGCGNIAIALTKNRVSCKILAVDISKEAICAAVKNAQGHDVSSQIEFTCFDLRDLFSFLKPGQLRLIVSNPPYIRSEDIDLLPEQLQYEPRVALDGGPDGLLFFRSIINQAGIYLAEGGYLALEIGEDQAAALTQIIRQAGVFGEIEVYKDLNQKDRVILVKRK